MEAQTERRMIRNWIVTIVAVFFALFQIYTAVLGTFTIFIQRGIHLAFGASLVFIVFPSSKKRNTLVLDILLALISSGIFVFIAWNNDYIVMRFLYVDPLPLLYKIVGIVGIVFVLEMARRTVGSVFTVLALICFLYIFFGQYIGGIFGHGGFTFKVAVEHLFYTTQGIFGIPVAVSSTYVYLFIMFGVFLETSGGGKFFLDFVSSLVGHKIGGPAKVALFSSAAMGTLSGSAIANVVTTGTFTIPLMKKIGFEKHYAAGVEAMASTGGQLMPPIMGVAAFILAQFSGYPYAVVAGAGIIPAILYYNSAFWQIHFYAIRKEVPRIKKDELPKSFIVFKTGWFYLLPLVVIVYFLMGGYTATTAAVYGLLTIILSTGIFGSRKKLGFRKVIQALEKTARAVLVVIGAVAASGIIIGSLTLTGLGPNISMAIMAIAKDSIPIALIFTAMMATILGLGMPTSGAYIICAAVLVPSLIQIGVPVLPAHFFALYYASLSVITPPVALASYTAAPIAGSDPWRTGLQGFKLALAAYIVPFFFVYNNALLGMGTVTEVILALISGFIGTVALASAIDGWMFTRLNWLGRIVLGIGAVFLIFAGFKTDIIGFSTILVMVLHNFWKYRITRGRSTEKLGLNNYRKNSAVDTPIGDANAQHSDNNE